MKDIIINMTIIMSLLGKDSQKQSFVDVLQNRCSSNKVAFGLNKSECGKVSNFTKKSTEHRCFPVKYAKFLITLFFQEHLRWLLLDS